MLKPRDLDVLLLVASQASLAVANARVIGRLRVAEARLTQSHKDLLNYFASMILDPEGHKKYMQHIRDTQQHR